MTPLDIDSRVQCIACTKLENRICQAAKAAGLSRTQSTAAIGRDFASIRQHCSAYRPRRPAKEAA